MVTETIDIPIRSAASYRWYVTALLFLVGVFNLMDRQILAILLEPIKRDLQLSDTAMGWLTGSAFVVFYAIASIPVARLVDSANRRSVIAAALILWSSITALSALAGSFLQLALARIGVGFGESATGPASYSMLSDLHAARTRVAALSMFATGAPVGLMLAFILGGWLNDRFGWRVALATIGAPGVLLGVVVWLTIKEPERGAAETGAADTARYSLSATLRFLRESRSFCWLSLGASLLNFAAIGLLVWSPAFMLRVHGMPAAQAGLWLGLATGLGGIIAGPLSGWIAARLAPRDPAWLLRLPALSSFLVAPCIALFLSLGTPAASLPMFFAAVVGCAAMFGPVMTVALGVAKIRMRATATALVALAYNLVGTGLGPLAVGAGSDVLAPVLGVSSIRGALWLAVATSFAAGLAFIAGAPHVRADMERAAKSQ